MPTDPVPTDPVPTDPVPPDAVDASDAAFLEDLVARIRPLDPRATAEARERQQRLTKPRGSLGDLEDLSVRLAGIAGVCPAPVPSSPAVAVFAADHGVHAEGVSPWPQEVTAQMVANFLAGGAAVNALAAQAGARVLVVDVGVAAELEPHAGLQIRKLGRGTANLRREPAMSLSTAIAALRIGAAIADELVRDGHDVLVTGDMGIANTTASAALIAAFTGKAAREVTGRGTGIDDPMWEQKVRVVDEALSRHLATTTTPLAKAAALGGFEHLALAGLMLGGAAHRVPVMLDGVIAGSAALIAQALAPHAVDFCFAGHRSAEPGHAHALDALGLTPILDLGMRLGEGSGGVLALHVLASSARVLRDMATFDAAGVADKEGSATLG